MAAKKVVYYQVLFYPMDAQLKVPRKMLKFTLK
jgi:hypothetical protein